MISHLLSFFKTLYFNLRYLSLRQAIKLPIAVQYKTKCRIKGNLKIISNQLSPFMIRIGFHTVPVKNEETTAIIVDGTLIFNGGAHIGRGTRIVVGKDGVLELGDNFAISASSYINCHLSIVIGKDVQLAWDDLLMDTDAHIIFDENGNVINKDKEIILGDKIWMGCDCKVLKGACIPNNCVVGANSVVTTSRFEPNSLIVGNPAKSIKKIGGWKL